MTMISHIWRISKFFTLHFCYVIVKKRLSILTQIGDKIRKARIKAGVSQAQLAFEIKTSPRQIQRIENGEVNTGIISLFKICEVLETPIKDLIDL